MQSNDNVTGIDISEQLRAVLKQLSTDQIKFVVARQEHTSDKDAALAIGVQPNTVYQWKSRKEAPLDEAVQLMAQDGVVVAVHLRRRMLAQAMLVKVEGLSSADEKVRQSVATEIIEWELGKAMQGLRHEGTGERGAIPIITEVLVQMPNDSDDVDAAVVDE
jgi:DNA-binding transcriptional regulator YiaG